MNDNLRLSKVKSRDTKPELIIRSELHKLGYRFIVNHKSLPGKPDIVFTKKRKIIFIHGCFWHRHKNCKRSQKVKKNSLYWENKFKNNITRDKLNLTKLRNMGWDVMIIWECEIQNLEKTLNKAVSFLGQMRTENGTTLNQ